jgi:hypothetical protein
MPKPTAQQTKPHSRPQTRTMVRFRREAARTGKPGGASIQGGSGARGKQGHDCP